MNQFLVKTIQNQSFLAHTFGLDDPVENHFLSDV